MGNDLSRETLRKSACELARLGGRTAEGFLGNVQAVRKADDTPVSEADHATQEAILVALAEHYPTHAVIVEEKLSRPERHAPIAEATYCWVIDPIDGTRNFVRGVGVYSTSVAVLCAGAPVAGAVWDATTGRVYSAEQAGGAYVDDERLQLEDRPIDADTIVMISSVRRRPVPAIIRSWMDCYLFRNQGSLCLHFAWIAAGLADAAYALECKLWDVAAAALIIEEAGGIVTDHAGNKLWPVDPASYRDQDIPIITGTPTMHRTLLSTLLGEGRT